MHTLLISKFITLHVFELGCTCYNWFDSYTSTIFILKRLLKASATIVNKKRESGSPCYQTSSVQHIFNGRIEINITKQVLHRLISAYPDLGTKSGTTQKRCQTHPYFLTLKLVTITSSKNA